MTIIDTSVLCELLQVPAKSDARMSAELREELQVRTELGERFVVPVTALIETGNHIAQAAGDRYKVAASEFRAFVEKATGTDPAFLVPRFELGADFLDAVCAGDSTGKTLPELASMGVGSGDISILVQRDLVKQAGAFEAVEVWSLDENLRHLAAST